MKHLMTALATMVLLGAPAAQAKNLDGALAFLPPDVSTLVVVDLEATRQTAFFKVLQAQLIDLTGYSREIKQLKREANLDIMTNVKTIIYGGPDEALRKAKQSLLILEGTFDVPKLREYYTKKSKLPLVEKSSALGGYFELGGDSAVGFFGDFAVFGSKALFEKALVAKQSSGGKTKLGGLLGRMKSGRDGFGVIAGSATLKKLLSKTFGGLKDVRAAGMTFDFTTGFALKIVGTFSDAATAESAAASIRKTLAETAADPDFKEAGLGPAIGKIQATTSGAEITLALTLDAATSKEFAGHLKELLE